MKLSNVICTLASCFLNFHWDCLCFSVNVSNLLFVYMYLNRKSLLDSVTKKLVSCSEVHFDCSGIFFLIMTIYLLAFYISVICITTFLIGFSLISVLSYRFVLPTLHMLQLCLLKIMLPVMFWSFCLCLIRCCPICIRLGRWEIVLMLVLMMGPSPASITSDQKINRREFIRYPLLFGKEVQCKLKIMQLKWLYILIGSLE